MRDDGVIGYMDKTDFEWELGAAMGGNKIYPSEADLRRNEKCLDQCGIVKVRVTRVEVVQEEDFTNA